MRENNKNLKVMFNTYFYENKLYEQMKKNK